MTQAPPPPTAPPAPPAPLSPSQLPSIPPAPGFNPTEPEIKLARNGNALTIVGRLNSAYQIKDITNALNLDGSVLDDQLVYDTDATAAAWANNVGVVLSKLATSVPNLRCQVKGDTVIIIGSVPLRNMKKELQEFIVENLEGTGIRHIDNRLTIKPR